MVLNDPPTVWDACDGLFEPGRRHKVWKRALSVCTYVYPLEITQNCARDHDVLGVSVRGVKEIADAYGSPGRLQFDALDLAQALSGEPLRRHRRHVEPLFGRGAQTQNERFHVSSSPGRAWSPPSGDRALR